MEAPSSPSSSWGRPSLPTRAPRCRIAAGPQNAETHAGQQDSRANAAAERASAAVVSRRVLLVEDEGVVALDLTFTLRQMGHVVAAHAASGAEAVQYASDVRPDLVLMDIRLNGPMDGIEAAQRIRAQHGELPVVFLTAFGDEGTRRRAQAIGCAAFLSKPISIHGLRDAISRLFEKSGGTP
ncbi:MAG: response regulator [Anaerolineae bacterium]|nr:response regulator [Anaerolineae bacterium]